MVFLCTIVNVKNISYCFEQYKPTDVCFRAAGMFFSLSTELDFSQHIFIKFLKNPSSRSRVGRRTERHATNVKGAYATI